jgi:hypothetical protein
MTNDPKSAEEAVKKGWRHVDVDINKAKEKAGVRPEAVSPHQFCYNHNGTRVCCYPDGSGGWDCYEQ